MEDPHNVAYRRSTFCSGGHCVEVASLPDGHFALRDSKNPDIRPLVYTRLEWAAFLVDIKAGKFDLH